MILREWRKSAGLSSGKLAKLVGVSQPMISYIETGRRHPGRGTVLAISKVTGISPALLMFGEDFETSSSEPPDLPQS